MCVALPGKVIRVSDKWADVDFSGNIVKARSGLVSVSPGDSVLVHAGCILQKVSESEADELREIFSELENSANSLHGAYVPGAALESHANAAERG